MSRAGHAGHLACCELHRCGTITALLRTGYGMPGNSARDGFLAAAHGASAMDQRSLCAQEQPALFRRLLRKTEGERSEWEYSPLRWRAST